MSRLFRDAVLDLAERHAFARPLVNSGRLSVPCTHDGSPLNTPDALPGGPARTRPGAPCPDAPAGDGFLLDQLQDGRFTVLGLNCDVAPVTSHGIAARPLRLDADGALADRYLGDRDGAVYLIAS